MTPPASSAAHAAPGTPLRRPPAPRRPRRVSGPARPARPAVGPGGAAQPARRLAVEGGGLAVSLLGLLESLSSHRMLDRLIRGRLWIGLVAFALIGIVALQLGLLKLNSGIGRALEHQGTLQRENAALAIENSEQASGSRVESEAGRLGMRLTAISGLKFHDSHARTDVPQAVSALKEAPAAAEAHTEAQAPASTGTSTSGEEGAAGGKSAEGASETGGEEAPASSEAGSAAGSESSEARAGTGESTGSATGAPSTTGGPSETGAPTTTGAPTATGEAATEAGGGTAAP